MIEVTSPLPVVPVPVIYPAWMNIVQAICFILLTVGLCVFIGGMLYIMIKEVNKP